MKMIDIKNFIENALDREIQVIPFKYNELSNDECIRFEIGQGGSDRGDVYEVIITIDVRSKNPNNAEEIALMLNKNLHHITNEKIGEHELIVVNRRRVYPLYIGVDENERHYYTSDYSLLLT